VLTQLDCITSIVAAIVEVGYMHPTCIATGVNLRARTLVP
jgi:hypothetical protein